MKKIMNGFLVLSSIAVFASCDAGKEKNAATVSPTVATDTSLAAADNTAVNNNTATNTDSNAMAAVKPNPAKKGKKGMVSVNTGENKTAGEMDAMDKEGYYTNVYPAYPGGDKALGSFFEKNIEYPQNASENGIEGTVKISFTVDENGKVSSPKTISPAIGYGVEEEALRVFKKMPAWKPGSLKGKNVKTRYTLPVRFQLEG